MKFQHTFLLSILILSSGTVFAQDLSTTVIQAQSNLKVFWDSAWDQDKQNKEHTNNKEFVLGSIIDAQINADSSDNKNNNPIAQYLTASLDFSGKMTTSEYVAYTVGIASSIYFLHGVAVSGYTYYVNRPLERLLLQDPDYLNNYLVAQYNKHNNIQVKKPLGHEVLDANKFDHVKSNTRLDKILDDIGISSMKVVDDKVVLVNIWATNINGSISIKELNQIIINTLKNNMSGNEMLQYMRKYLIYGKSLMSQSKSGFEKFLKNSRFQKRVALGCSAGLAVAAWLYLWSTTEVPSGQSAIFDQWKYFLSISELSIDTLSYELDQYPLVAASLAAYLYDILHDVEVYNEYREAVQVVE